MTDDDLVMLMRSAYARESQPNAAPFAAWHAVLQVVRAHDGDAEDAARYRWLRHINKAAQGTPDAYGLHVMTGKYADDPIYGDALDAAIDAARGKE